MIAAKEINTIEIKKKIFIYNNKSNFFTIPKEINLYGIDFLILKSLNSNEIWISKLYKLKYGQRIWVSNKIKLGEKFKIIKKINLKEAHYNKISNILGKEFVCRDFNKKEIIIFKPPKGAFFTINKNIILNEDVAWLIGFYLAEGTKTKNYVDIVNKELSLLYKSLKIFKINFGIKKSDWRAIIKTNKKGNELKFLKRYWRKKLNKKVITSYSRLSYEEAIEFRINSMVLAYILKKLFNHFIKKITKNKKLSKAFLRGYIIGDGSINIRKKQVHSIGITVKNKEYLGYLINIFSLIYNEKPRIRRTKGCYEVYYCKINILTNIFLDRLFIDLKRQWLKLVNGYKNKKYVVARTKYWDKIISKSLTANQIAKLSDNSHWSVREALNGDIKLGLVKAKYRHLNKYGPPNKFYQLSIKGEKLLSLLNRKEL